MSLKAAIYCRLSEEDRDKKKKEDDSESIQNQKALLLQYMLDNNWELHDIYSDDDYKGADRNRPQWKRLIEDAEQKKFDVIICKTQSRFTREMEMVEKYIHGLLPIWGVRFIGVADHADTDNKGNKKQRQIMGLTNEWFLEDLSDSIKAALKTRRENGYHIGSFSLYGYLKDPENKGHLIIDEEAAQTVREVYELYASGYGKTAIARLLNDKSVPNPTEYKRLKGMKYKTPKHKSGACWKYFAISNMLENEIYIGNMVQGKYGSVSYKTGINKPKPKEKWIRKEATHDPIIDIDLWERVQERLKLQSKPFITGKIGLFAKKARCLDCGYTMRSTKTRGKHYLKCSTRHTAKNECEGSFISMEMLEQVVLNELQALLDENFDKAEVSGNINILDNFKQRIDRLESDKTKYTDKIAECSTAIKNLYLDKVKELITESDYIELSRTFSKDRERLETVVKDLDSQISALKRKQEDTSDKQKIIDKYAGVEKLDRVMVEKLIDYITVGKRDKVTRQIPIEIHWNF